MRIGVDIDGVLNYRQEFVFAYGTKFCVEEGIFTGIREADSHSLRRIFGITDEQRDEFWRRYARYQMWVWPAQCFAAEMIHKLRNEGHEIYIVTGRSNHDLRTDGMPEGKTWEEITIDWLKRNKIEYDGIGFDLGRPVPGDKGTYCAEQKIDVMIDDLPAYLETMVGKTQIMVYDQPYNRELNLPGAVRVHSWYEIYDKIRKMEVAKDESSVD